MESNFSVDDALADVQQARERVAARMVTPRWYYPAISWLMGLLIFSFSWPWHGFWAFARIAVGMVVAIGSGLCARTYLDRTGVWYSFRAVSPAGRRFCFAMVAFIAAMFGLSACGRLTSVPLLVGSGAGLLAVWGLLFLTKRFDAQVRADILNGDVDGIMAK